MNFRKSRTLMWIGFAVGILIMALGIGFENEKVTVGFMAAGIIVFAIAAIQAFIFYVCPYCGYSLMPGLLFCLGLLLHTSILHILVCTSLIQTILSSS